MVPTTTVVRDGVTYVTGMGGTYDVKLAANAAGRARECRVPATGAFSEEQHSKLSAALAPLARRVHPWVSSQLRHARPTRCRPRWSPRPTAGQAEAPASAPAADPGRGLSHLGPTVLRRGQWD